MFILLLTGDFLFRLYTALIFGFSQLSYDVSEAGGAASISVALINGTIGSGIGISLAGQTNDLLVGDRALGTKY